MTRELGVLGVPSSAALTGPGRSGRQPCCAGPGCCGGPQRRQRRPHNLQAVLGVLRETAGKVGRILADGRVPLVLGGECTVTIAVLSACLDHGVDPALLYMDGGVDLFTPATNPTGILDSMGVAHLLDEPGAAAELAGFGRRRPLLGGDRLLLFGYTDYPGAEHDVMVRRELAGLPVEQVRGRPAQAAEEALARVSASADRFLLHLDLDVVDFIDLPVADIPQHNDGLAFDEATTCLAVFARHEGLAGLVITEFNPDHGAEDGSTADALVRGLVGVFAGDPSGRDQE
jgi:arginase